MNEITVSFKLNDDDLKCVIGNLFTSGGNVGINTVTPGFTLDVNGSTRITNTNASSMGTLIVAGPSTNSSYQQILHLVN